MACAKLQIVLPVTLQVVLAAPRRCQTTGVTFDQALEHVPETKVTTLQNGLRIASEDSGLPTATVRYAHILLLLCPRQF